MRTPQTSYCVDPYVMAADTTFMGTPSVHSPHGVRPEQAHCVTYDYSSTGPRG